LALLRQLLAIPIVDIAPEPCARFQRHSHDRAECAAGQAPEARDRHRKFILVFAVHCKVDEACRRVISHPVVSGLQQIGCLVDQGLVQDERVVDAVSEVDGLTSLCEVGLKVDGFVCGLPALRQLKKHRIEVESSAPVDPIGVPGHVRHRPSLARLELGPEGDDRVVAL